MGLYTTLEDKWYDLLDSIEKVVPIYSVVTPIDKIFPSFILALIIVLFIILGLVLVAVTFVGGGGGGGILSSHDTVVVNVLDVAGKPLSGVQLFYSPGCDGLESDTRITPASGMVAIPICSNTMSFDISKTGYVSQSEIVSVSKDKNQVFTLQAAEVVSLSRKVSVKVIDTTQNIIVGATLTMTCLSNNTTVTVPDSENQSPTGFIIDTIKDCPSLQLTASAPGYADKVVILGETDDRKVLTLESNVQTGGVRFTTTAGADILPTIRIVVTSPNGTTDEVRTDASGYLRKDYPAGVYSYIAYSASGIPNPGTFTVVPDDTIDVPIVFAGDTPITPDNNSLYLNLQVASDTNEILTSAVVTLYVKSGTDANIFRKDLFSSIIGRVEGGSIGVALPTGITYYAWVTKIGYESKLVPLVPQKQGVFQSVILKKGDGGRLKVQVVDDLNRQQSNAIVTITSSTFPAILDTKVTLTDGNGAIFVGLPAGTYLISAKDVSARSTGTASAVLSQGGSTTALIKLNLIETQIKFSFFDEKGAPASPLFAVYTKQGNQFVKIADGNAAHGQYLSPRLKSNTLLKLVITDSEFFPMETLVYPFSSIDQSKDVFVRRVSSLPNQNQVQLFLDQVYANDPTIIAVPKVATTLARGGTYYFAFTMVLRSDTNDSARANFVVSPFDDSIISDTSPIRIVSVDSTDGYYPLYAESAQGFEIPLPTTEYTRAYAKQANAVFPAQQGPTAIPIVLEVAIDDNAVGKISVAFQGRFANESSLEYQKDFNVETPFCLRNCPPLMFSNFLRWNTRPEVLLDARNENGLFIGERYVLRTTLTNLTDNDFGDSDLNSYVGVTSTCPANAPCLSFTNGRLTDDKLFSLRPLATVPSGDDQPLVLSLEAKKVASNLILNEVVGGDSVGFLPLNSRSNNPRFKVVTKNVLSLTLPSSIEAGAENFLAVKTIFKNSMTPAPNTFWQAQKATPDGNVTLVSGYTDDNAIQVISFDARDLLAGDKIYFTASDDLGSVTGTVVVPVTSRGPPRDNAVVSCVHVKLASGIDVNVTSTGSVDLPKDASTTLILSNSCSTVAAFLVRTDLGRSANEGTIDVNGNYVLTITASPRNMTDTPGDQLLGVYPLQIAEVNRSTGDYHVVALVDITVNDPSSCFQLSQAIYDLSNTQLVGAQVTNSCLTGRKDAYYPQITVSDPGVSVSYKKDGLPLSVDANIRIIAEAIESHSIVVSKLDKGTFTGTGTSTFTAPDNAAIADTPDTLKNKYTPLNRPAETVTSKAEPDLPQTNPDYSFYALPPEAADIAASTILNNTGKVTATTTAGASSGTATASATGNSLDANAFTPLGYYAASTYVPTAEEQSKSWVLQGQQITGTVPPQGGIWPASKVFSSMCAGHVRASVTPASVGYGSGGSNSGARYPYSNPFFTYMAVPRLDFTVPFKPFSLESFLHLPALAGGTGTAGKCSASAVADYNLYCQIYASTCPSVVNLTGSYANFCKAYQSYCNVSTMKNVFGTVGGYCSYAVNQYCPTYSNYCSVGSTSSYCTLFSSYCNVYVPVDCPASCQNVDTTSFAGATGSGSGYAGTGYPTGPPTSTSSTTLAATSGTANEAGTLDGPITNRTVTVGYSSQNVTGRLNGNLYQQADNVTDSQLLLSNFCDEISFSPSYGSGVSAPLPRYQNNIFEVYYSAKTSMGGAAITPIEKLPGVDSASWTCDQSSSKVNYQITKAWTPVIVTSLGFAGYGDNGGLLGPRIYGNFYVGSSGTLVLETDAAYGRETFAKIQSTYNYPLSFVPKEGVVVGSTTDYRTYAVPVKQWDSINSIKVNGSPYVLLNSWTDGSGQSRLRLEGIHGNGYVSWERARDATNSCSYKKYGTTLQIPDYNSPLVEYSSDGLIAYRIDPTSIPPGVRVFLKGGKVYAEYVGDIHSVYDAATNTTKYVSDISVPASNIIDFNIVDNGITGTKYAIMHVSDWVQNPTTHVLEKKTVAFQVKLIGNLSDCFAADGTPGVTGTNYAPRLAFNWDLNINAAAGVRCDYLNAAGAFNTNYVYCDGVQFANELVVKLNTINTLLASGNLTDVSKNSLFHAYLLRDNYTSDFFKDYSTYYGSHILESYMATFGRFKSLIDSGNLRVAVWNPTTRQWETDENASKLPYGGIYQVVVDINFIDPTTPVLFKTDGGNEVPNAIVTIRFTPEKKAWPYNPLYEMPIDGAISGDPEGENTRFNYGTSFVGPGTDLQLTPDIHSQTYAGTPQAKVSYTFNTSLDYLGDGTVLKMSAPNGLDAPERTLVFSPSQPNPIIASITGGPADLLAQYSLFGSVSGALIGAPMQWTLLSSTMKSRASDACATFNGAIDKKFTDDGAQNGLVRKLTFTGGNAGTIGVGTVFYTPPQSLTNNDAIAINSVSPETVLKLYGAAPAFKLDEHGKQVTLNYFDSTGDFPRKVKNYDTLATVIQMIRDSKMCMSSSDEKNLSVWWNPAEASTLLQTALTNKDIPTTVTESPCT